MPKIKVGPTGQVKIPAVIAKRYNLQKGDILDVRDIGNSIIFIPERVKKRVKKNEKLRRELNERIWNQMEQEAEDDIKSGRMSGPFETVEELLRDLKDSKRKS